MGQTAIDGVEGLNRAGEISRFSGSRSVALPPITILAVLTSRLLQRPTTTELLLIVMWITLELCALTMLHSSGALGATAAIVLAIILLILLIADMACYLAYCHLPPMPAFIDGTAPLIAVTVFSEIVVAMIV